MENKAFIFDMDGVLVNSERAWDGEEGLLLESIFGKAIADKIGNTVGIGIHTFYETARRLGTTISYEEYLKRYDDAVAKVYGRSAMTEGLDELAANLLSSGFKLGLVTASPMSWIERIIPRLSFKEKLDVVISLHEREDLRPKPAPDGYIEALEILKADPKASFVLEDSNAGIAAGKASGAFTIGFRGNLTEGYEQTGADAYADTMDDVIKLVERFTQQ